MHPPANDPPLPPITPVTAEQHVTSTLRIANRAVAEDIESYSAATTLPGDPTRWHDTRPMLDPREHAPEALDMAVEALAYAEFAGLVVRHPEHRHLVRLVKR